MEQPNDADGNILDFLGDGAEPIAESTEGDTAEPQGNPPAADSGQNDDISLQPWPEGHPLHEAEKAADVPAKDVKRHEYWQSEADKQKAARQRAEEVATAKDVMLTEMAKRIKELESKSAPQEIVKQDGPVAPVKPTRPEDYNEADALNDPKSESAKYRTSLDRYRDSMLEYMTQTMNAQKEALAEAARQEQVAQERNRTMGKIAVVLETKYGLSRPEAVDFIRTFESPDSLSLDNLVQLYKLQRNKTSQRTVAAKAAEELLSRRGIPTDGVNLAKVPSAADTSLNDSDAFSASLIAAAKSRR